MNAEKDFFKAICRVSRALGTTLNRDELLDLIIDIAIETMQVKAARLFLYDPEQNQFRAVAQKGLSKEYVARGLTEPCKIVSVLEKDGFLYSHDAPTDSRLNGHETKRSEGIASILVVPVKSEGRLIGGLSLFTEAPREFSPEEIEFATAMAEQGGVAIEKARLFEKLKDNTRIFLDFALGMNSSLDLKKILHILTADVAEILHVKAASILLVDENRKTLEHVASYGLSEKYLNRGPLCIEKSVKDTLDGVTVLIQDATKDQRVQFREEKMREGIASILSAPIKTKDKVIGVLRLYTAAARDFGEDEIMLVNALAQLGGLAIQNASMYLMLETDMKHLKEEIWSHRFWF